MKLLDQYIKNHLPEGMKSVQKELDSNDCVIMYRTAHSLVGSSRTMGIMRLGEMMDQMQRCVAANNPNPDFNRYKFLFDFA